MLLGALAVVTLGAPSPVFADHVPNLEGQLTDDAGALDGDRDAAEDALQELRDEHNLQLYVLYTDTTEDLSAEEFAFDVAAENSLGGNDALLVVAIEDRTVFLWVADTASYEEVSNEEINDLLAGEVEPRLADGEFGEAVVAAAESLADASEPGAGFGTILVVVLIIGALIVVGNIVWAGVQRRQARAAHRGGAGSPHRPAGARGEHAPAADR